METNAEQTRRGITVVLHMANLETLVLSDYPFPDAPCRITEYEPVLVLLVSCTFYKHLNCRTIRGNNWKSKQVSTYTLAIAMPQKMYYYYLSLLCLKCAKTQFKTNGLSPVDS